VKTRLLLFSFILTSLMGLVAPPARAADNQNLIDRIVARARESGSDTLVIIENGHIRYQGRFTKREKPQDLQSVTKSICAIAVGILLDEGKIDSLDTPMWHWIPSWRKDRRKSKITLKMIMSQTSGLPDSSAIYSAPNRISFAENASLVAEPGEKFIYSSVGSALLQRVISRSAGMSVTEFAKRQIFGPLGITSFEWYKDKAGQEKTGGALSMMPSDLAKLGEMMLNGTYRGRTIMSMDSISKIHAKSQPHENYGLMWWLRNPPGLVSNNQFGVFYADGWGGQYIVVYPAKNIVAVRTRDPSTIDESHMDVQGFGEFPEMIASWK
jgi:CubicO group peptidase (beta-lactamase class C family)